MSLETDAASVGELCEKLDNYLIIAPLITLITPSHTNI